MTACQIFLNNLTLKGKNTVSDSSSSSSFARQLVEQVGCEVLQHHMLSATKTLQEEMKSKTEHNKNLDEIVPLCVLSCPSCTQSWKGQKRCHSAVVSTHFTCYGMKQFLSFSHQGRTEAKSKKMAKPRGARGSAGYRTSFFCTPGSPSALTPTKLI